MYEFRESGNARGTSDSGLFIIVESSCNHLMNSGNFQGAGAFQLGKVLSGEIGCPKGGGAVGRVGWDIKK